MAMIEEMVRNELNTRVWTFKEIANVSTTVETLTKMVYENLSNFDRLELVWDVEVVVNDNKVIYFGELYKEMVMSELRVMVADIVKDELSSAKIVFNKNEVDKNEVSERSLGGQSSKRRTPDEASDSEE